MFFPDGKVTVAGLNKMKYLKAAFRENLRTFPPLVMNVRQIKSDGNFKGYLVPKETLVLMPNLITGFNPNLFPEPEK